METLEEDFCDQIVVKVLPGWSEGLRTARRRLITDLTEELGHIDSLASTLSGPARRLKGGHLLRIRFESDQLPERLDYSQRYLLVTRRHPTGDTLHEFIDSWKDVVDCHQTLLEGDSQGR